VRVSVGTHEENDVFLRALDKVLLPHKSINA